MIRIDHISFEFAAADETFAHSLYADWDDFCRTCFEKVMEESLSMYDRDRVLHEIASLDLDLGSIPQEDFYSEFPKKLREELLKALPQLQLRLLDRDDVKTIASRFANLIYFLKQGTLKAEWADIDFNLSEELDRLMTLDHRYMEKIAELCTTNEYVLRRLLLQTNNNASLVCLYSIAMDKTFSVQDEKRRFMEVFLEIQPGVPVRFIHESDADERLHGMAELLDTRSVHRIMEKEAEEHAEVDIPPYWHYLYEWLIKYYPYNGVAIFGGKRNFIGHLHYRLLAFIRKRNHTFYLSKTELTAAFLLEVFGAAYYKEVLNAIYNMQPHNADGSPAYDGYYNRELYRIFLQLSLLHLPKSMNDVDETVPEEKTASLLIDFSIEDLAAVLKDTGRSDADLERYKDEFAEVIWELHKQGLLEDAINLLSLSATEFIIRQMVIRYIGTEETEKLLILISQLSADENAAAAYLQNKSLTLRTQVLVWLAKEIKAHTGDTAESKRELLQVLAREKPQKMIEIFRELPQNEEAVLLTATYIPAEKLLAVVEKADAKQAMLLSQTANLLQKERGRFAFLSNMTLSFTTALSQALLLFVKDNDTLDGRTLTEQEVVAKFLSCLYYVYTRRTDYNDRAEWSQLQEEVANGLGLYGTNTGAISASENSLSERLLSEYGNLIDLPLELLTDDTLPEEIRKRMFLTYMRSRPAELLSHIQQLAKEGKLPLDKWGEWGELSEWLRLVASVSLTLEELLRQIVEYLLYRSEIVDKKELKHGLVTFIATSEIALFTYYVDKAEVVRSFLVLLPAIQVITKIKKEKIMNEMMDYLGITPEEERMLEGSQENDFQIALVGNAGLCLLSPWFPRLFAMIGYLDKERRDFKDTASRIRAIFLLQYMVFLEEKEYREPELVFNRLLVALPMHIPLPKQMELTAEEKQIAESMLTGVKDNWPKMHGTSMRGFGQSFLLRDGRLEQQDERWLLTVESHVYDILLDSIPWAFRQIRFPWLKKYIQVSWHEKQGF